MTRTHFSSHIEFNNFKANLMQEPLHNGIAHKEKKCEFEVVLKKSFSWRSNLSNDNIISAYARSKNRCGKCQFWGLKKGSGFGEPGGTVRIPTEYPKGGIFEKKIVGGDTCRQLIANFWISLCLSLLKNIMFNAK